MQSPKANVSSAPVLPAYTQLFREDGSRLADEGEALPQYRPPMNRKGSITGPGAGLGVDRPEGSNRIVPSQVVDEAINSGDANESRAAAVEHEIELAEMSEAEALQDSRQDESVDMDAAVDLPHQSDGSDDGMDDGDGQREMDNEDDGWDDHRPSSSSRLHATPEATLSEEGPSRSVQSGTVTAD